MFNFGSTDIRNVNLGAGCTSISGDMRMTSLVALTRRLGTQSSASGREAARANTDTQRATIQMDVIIPGDERQTTAGLPILSTCQCTGEFVRRHGLVRLTRAGVRVTVWFYHGDAWIMLHKGKPHDGFNHQTLPEKFAAFQQQYITPIMTRIIVPWSEEHLPSEGPTLLITSDCYRDASFLCNLLRPASVPMNDTTADAPRPTRGSASHRRRPSHGTVRLEHYNDGQPRGPHDTGMGSDPTPAEFGDDRETGEIMLTDFMEADQSNATTIIPQSNPTPPASEITDLPATPPASENATTRSNDPPPVSEDTTTPSSAIPPAFEVAIPQPHRVRPASKDTVMKLEWKVIVEAIVSECTVCFQEVKVGQKVLTLACKHGFHNACIERWLLEESGTCPICREEVEAVDEIDTTSQLGRRSGGIPTRLNVRMTSGGGMQIMSRSHRNSISNVRAGNRSRQVMLSSDEDVRDFLRLNII